MRTRFDAQSKAIDLARENELKVREREIAAKEALFEAKARLQSETKTQEESKDREEKEESIGDRRKRQRHTYRFLKGRRGGRGGRGGRGSQL